MAADTAAPAAGAVPARTPTLMDTDRLLPPPEIEVDTVTLRLPARTIVPVTDPDSWLPASVARTRKEKLPVVPVGATRVSVLVELAPEARDTEAGENEEDQPTGSDVDNAKDAAAQFESLLLRTLTEYFIDPLEATDTVGGRLVQGAAAIPT